ncbi:MAG: enoyl-CoA hydratase/isomerase family protein [Chloroflexota bacterium]
MQATELESGHIDLTIEETLATITLNRPDKLNALTMEMLTDLERIANELDASQTVSVVVIQSNCEKAFSVGADIKAWSALEPLAMWHTWIAVGHRVFQRLTNLRQPLIAALNGFTLGGGLELALTADIRIAQEGIRLGLPETSIGAIPAWTGITKLPEIVGTPRAKQMIFSAQPIEVTTAEAWGLVNEIVSPDQLNTRVQALAEQIGANASISVQICKQLMNRDNHPSLPIESLAGALAAFTQDGQEGTQAFLEKRSPRYVGK